MRSGAWILGLCLLAAPGWAAPDGWSIARDGKACVATGPQSGNALLSLAVMPPQFLLFFESPDFPLERQTRSVSLRIDNGPVARIEALGSDHVYGVAISPPIGQPLRTATDVQLQVEQKTYRFAVKNTADALDEVARCAGVRPITEQWVSAPPRPVPNALGWQVVDFLPGTDTCSVRREGAAVNTSLVFAQGGTLILVAGRPDWAKWGGAVKGSLAIDGAPAQTFTGFGFQSVVMWPVKDPAIVAALVRAKSLMWHLPWGDFPADVTGLGSALEALKTCKRPE